MKSIISTFVLSLVLVSCNENFHIGAEDLVDPTVTVELPIQVFPTETYNLSGDCSPNGATVTLTSPEMSPIEVSCECSNERYTCPVVTFPALSGSTAPQVTAQIEDSLGQLGEGEDKTELIVAQVELAEFSTPVVVGDSATIQGTCAPVGASISITIPSELSLSNGTSSVTCTCASDGTFDLSAAECGSVTVTANRINSGVSIDAVITDSNNNTANDSDDLEVVCPSLAPSSFLTQRIFNYTGSDQSFDMSALAFSVCWLKVRIWGAGGAGDSQPGSARSRGGAGGYLEFIIPPSQVLNLPTVIEVVVGEGGKVNSLFRTYGEGGAGGSRSFAGANASSGGGLSGLFKTGFSSVSSDSDIIAISGGGGGGSAFNSFQDIGGAGGGLTGGDGNSPSSSGGGGGDQVSGGFAGPGGGNPGDYLFGADGGESGGGGGGGYYGGGSGGFILGDEKVGGGGSGYIDPTLIDASTLLNLQGIGSTPAVLSTPFGIDAGIGGPQITDGGNGLVVLEW